MIHDAHIVALCLEHGVSEIITGDRDFSRFEGLKIVNPFAGSEPITCSLIFGSSSLTPGTYTRHLFIPQRYHGIDLCRTTSGQVSCNDSYGGERTHCHHQRHRIARGESEQHILKQMHGGK